MTSLPASFGVAGERFGEEAGVRNQHSSVGEKILDFHVAADTADLLDLDIGKSGIVVEVSTVRQTSAYIPSVVKEAGVNQSRGRKFNYEVGKAAVILWAAIVIVRLPRSAVSSMLELTGLARRKGGGQKLHEKFLIFALTLCYSTSRFE